MQFSTTYKQVIRYGSALCLAVAMASCATAPAMQLTQVEYADMPHWSADNHQQAIGALKQSCRAKKPQWPSSSTEKPTLGHAKFWQHVCHVAGGMMNDAMAKSFFEQYFAPHQLAGHGDKVGTYTGYYVPMVDGKRTADETYRYPVYATPKDYRSGETYTHDRAAIDGGALDGRGLEILWLKSSVDRFFLQVQGSGMVRLAGGGMAKLAYASKTGHAYVPIGRGLIKSGEIAREDMSMQAIRAWLLAHPDQAAAVMQTNPSYVFFSLHDGLEPVVGAQGVPLSPMRSLAVDKTLLPYGLPAYISTTDGTINRLMMTQDTGSAIRGAVRGDVFMGYGAAAGEKAGVLNAKGEMYLLLPRLESVPHDG